MMHSDMASDTQTRVQRTVRLDSDLDDQIQVLAKTEDRSLESMMRVLLTESVRRRASDDAAAS